jgi:hypothetical protein
VGSAPHLQLRRWTPASCVPASSVLPGADLSSGNANTLLSRYQGRCFRRGSPASAVLVDMAIATGLRDDPARIRASRCGHLARRDVPAGRTAIQFGQRRTDRWGPMTPVTTSASALPPNRKETRRWVPPWSPWRGAVPLQHREPPSNARILVGAIKAIHTPAWFSIESCMVYVLYAGFRSRSDRRVALAAGVVAGESLIFAASGFRCPLTQWAEGLLGAERGGVTDIYLPKWFAHNLPAIHVPLIALAVVLHARNLRRGKAAPVGQT